MLFFFKTVVFPLHAQTESIPRLFVREPCAGEKILRRFLLDVSGGVNVRLRARDAVFRESSQPLSFSAVYTSCTT